MYQIRSGSALPLLFTLLLAMCVSGCSSRLDSERVAVGRQVWMSRNLDTDRYRNGDPVRHAASEAEWHDAASKEEGAWCWYGGERENGRVYGRLYNWYALADPRGLAPKGWHIPSDREWQELVDFLGKDPAAGRALKSPKGWGSPAGDEGSSGFRALPAGSRNCLGGFFALGRDAFFWSATPSGDFEAWNREFTGRNDAVRRVSVNKSIGFSVRCLKD
ncbi:MAG: fibrobacter succinogenes major paralogous domain-containing protein [Chlorobium sp.]|uniref:fibrobacter succinogenes major paralogous domain-containing protein n=1 Tax=Chlorobium sp. TaxID=1095 RepID=UPI0025C2C86C|nr:fibrobacter succinogenes major paralogous domain-containing protein [Chlorobium sp.]MCF8382467.1 fibrobacter succinogenes major paralogous domain-containing protein [Chlorobium sp.]